MSEGSTVPWVFLGSSSFAASILTDLVRRFSFRPVLVVTRPDKPAGRGWKLTPPPVADAARALDLPLAQEDAVNSPDFIASLASTGARMGLVVAFGRILSDKLLASLPLGFFNVHLSLLPELRGAAPVPWAIARGYSRTGVTVFKIVRELDAGPILSAAEVPIRPSDTASDLFERLYEPSLELAADALRRVPAGDFVLTPQDHSRATFAPRVTREHGRLDPAVPAWKLERLVRAFRDYPGTFAFWHSGFDPARAAGSRVLRIRILDVSLPLEPDTGHSAGYVFRAHPKEGLFVQAGLGVLRIDSLRPEGRSTMSGPEFVRGYRVREGDFVLKYGKEGQ